MPCLRHCANELENRCCELISICRENIIEIRGTKFISLKWECFRKAIPRNDFYRQDYLRHKIFEWFHDSWTLSFLIIWETSRDDDHRRQHNAQVQLQSDNHVGRIRKKIPLTCIRRRGTYVISCWVFRCSGLNGISHEAENGSDPQQHWKPSEHLLAKLHPFRSRLRGTELVRPVAF